MSDRVNYVAVRKMLMDRALDKSVEELRDKRDSIQAYLGGSAYNLMSYIFDKVKLTEIDELSTDEKVNLLKKLAEVVKMVWGKEQENQTNIQINISDQEVMEAYERLGRLNAG